MFANTFLRHLRVARVAILIPGLLLAVFQAAPVRASTPNVRSVYATNVTDISFSVAWVTDVSLPGSGAVYYGTSQTASSLTGRVNEQALPTGAKGDIHYTTISSVLPNTTYYFYISIAGASYYGPNGQPYSVRTAATATNSSPNRKVTGRVVQADQQTPAIGALVSVAIYDPTGLNGGVAATSTTVSTLSDTQGNWSLTLNPRTQDGSGYFQYQTSGTSDVLQANAEGGMLGDAPLTSQTLTFDSTGTLALTQPLALGTSTPTPTSTLGPGPGTPSVTPTATSTGAPSATTTAAALSPTARASPSSTPTATSSVATPSSTVTPSPTATLERPEPPPPTDTSVPVIPAVAPNVPAPVAPAPAAVPFNPTEPPTAAARPPLPTPRPAPSYSATPVSQLVVPPTAYATATPYLPRFPFNASATGSPTSTAVTTPRPTNTPSPGVAASSIPRDPFDPLAQILAVALGGAGLLGLGAALVAVGMIRQSRG